jgi:hypothetical protein
MNKIPSNSGSRTILLIGIAVLVKLLLCPLVELNNDEVYYYTYAQHLQWNYFDHPPMVGVLIRLFTAGCHLPHEFFIRLGAVVAGAICTWTMFRTGRLLQDDHTGWLAACLFTASFYASIIAGMLILPDTPQLVFWLMSVYVMLYIVKNKPAGKELNGRLLLLGVLIGLSILSKVHAVFLWLGFGGYLLFHQRKLLTNPFLYLGAIITVAMLVPSYLWTLHNNFVTSDYHSSRISFNHLQVDSFFRELIGSVMYNNPVNVVLIVLGCKAVYTKRSDYTGAWYRLFGWLGFPLIGTVLLLSVCNDTLPHWSGPAYTTLTPLAALWLRNRYTSIADVTAKRIPAIIKWALGLTMGVLLTAVMLINYWPGSLGNTQLPAYGKNDVTLDMCGWRQFAHRFSIWDQHNQQVDPSFSPACIFADYWFPAAHLDFYVGSPLHIPVRAVGDMGAIHHFAWLNQRLPPLQTEANAYYITVSNFYEPPPPALGRYFQTTTPPVLIKQERSGHLVRYFYIYRLLHYKGGLPGNGVLP